MDDFAGQTVTRRENLPPVPLSTSVPQGMLLKFHDVVGTVDVPKGGGSSCRSQGGNPVGRSSSPELVLHHANSRGNFIRAYDAAGGQEPHRLHPVQERRPGNNHFQVGSQGQHAASLEEDAMPGKVVCPASPAVQNPAAMEQLPSNLQLEFIAPVAAAVAGDGLRAIATRMPNFRRYLHAGLVFPPYAG
jgi:hypothetical protein